MDITFKPVTRENWQEALQLSVYPEQQEFVADMTPPVAIALAKAYVRPGNKQVEPYAIYNRDKMIGFFNLHYTPDSIDDFWIFHFFIDKAYQRQGYGKATFDQCH
jgi:diamine N-acetyltransferase